MSVFLRNLPNEKSTYDTINTTYRVFNSKISFLLLMIFFLGWNSVGDAVAAGRPAAQARPEASRHHFSLRYVQGNHKMP